MGLISLEQAKEQRLVKNEYYSSGTSFPEQFIYRSLLQIFPEAKNRFIDPMIKMEYDINIPELKLYIEYNGIVFHNSEEKQKRDKIKQLHCEKQNISFIQIVEDSEISEVTKSKTDNIVQYKVNNSGTLKSIIANLINIIEDICSMYKLAVTEFDFNRSFYEAMLISSKYQYKINYNASGEIMGKENKSQVYCEYETMYDSELHNKNQRLTVKPVVEHEQKLLQDQYDKLNVLMFNGNSLQMNNIEPLISIEEKQTEIEHRLDNIHKIEKSMEINIKRQAEQQKALEKREEIIAEKEELLEKRHLELNKLIEEELQREFNYRSVVDGELQEEKKQLQQREKELAEKEKNYQKIIDRKYIKQREKLKAEYDTKHELLDSYCDKRIKAEVEEQIKDIRRISQGQCDMLREKLSQQKIMAARQMLSVKCGL